jgi:hypothetical protein
VLTDRERQVLGLVAEALTNAEIGERLFIAPGTAKVHVARLLDKLSARGRVQLVITRTGQGSRPGGDGYAIRPARDRVSPRCWVFRSPGDRRAVATTSDRDRR